MKKLANYLGIFVVTALLLGVASVPALADRPEPKIKICHSTDSQTNPYSDIEVDQDSIDGDLDNDNGQGDHYLEHNGPIWSEGIADHSWGDIIPPIPDGNGGFIHEGLNWTPEGQAIYNNGCNALVPTETPEATPSATPTATPSATPTDDPAPTPTPTQAPSNGGGTGGGEVLGATTEAPKPQGEVLGATTMAGTGVAEDMAMNIVGILGALSMGTGVTLAKRKA